ncbi:MULTISPECIES: dTDP-4-dehydrorhamnose 3,5-epimerase family protein [Micromonospora]|uniref:dTDP-4-dehydrorhamnose 3,5-epimerase family protein n=1 Tax=Micromonospora TaxID=1873 RepID=UPI00064C2374|nr:MULTISPECIES: dTDP-4-dehydrorhamnose 3,5-epimerase family protein [Micromonospora]MDG4750893.1 dTDP-4-dehydrorhamnose 3,5-epimerase family protein [Micromonospora sp. WMMD718]UFN96872.1 dTDP-4-dehydrorhamnose 3,5-epimerase family protein [Micromonospora aurantiaca]
MKIQPLSIEGAWTVEPEQHTDSRGVFLEWYRADRLAEVTGHEFHIAQANLSVSARGVVRGIHFADVPPGQAKYVICVRGAVLDVVVDLRVGSPTYGRWEAVPLNDVQRRGVYLGDGLGHGFCALTDDAVVSYLCSTSYDPTREHAVHPFDEELGIDWLVDTPSASARDAAAPTLARLREAGLLPRYDRCRPAGAIPPDAG